MLRITLIRKNLVFSLNNRKRLDVMIADEVKKEILKRSGKKSNNVIFDLTGIEFIDSTSFAMLLALNNAINETGKRFYIANLSSEVLELLQLVKMENIFKVYPFETLRPKLAA